MTKEPFSNIVIVCRVSLNYPATNWCSDVASGQPFAVAFDDLMTRGRALRRAGSHQGLGLKSIIILQ